MSARVQQQYELVQQPQQITQLNHLYETFKAKFEVGKDGWVKIPMQKDGAGFYFLNEGGYVYQQIGTQEPQEIIYGDRLRQDAIAQLTEIANNIQLYQNLTGPQKPQSQAQAPQATQTQFSVQASPAVEEPRRRGFFGRALDGLRNIFGFRRSSQDLTATDLDALNPAAAQPSSFYQNASAGGSPVAYETVVAPAAPLYQNAANSDKTRSPSYAGRDAGYNRNSQFLSDFPEKEVVFPQPQAYQNMDPQMQVQPRTRQENAPQKSAKELQDELEENIRQQDLKIAQKKGELQRLQKNQELSPKQKSQGEALLKLEIELLNQKLRELTIQKRQFKPDPKTFQPTSSRVLSRTAENQLRS